MNQAEIAKILGLSRATVSRYKSGKTNAVKAEQIKALLEFEHTIMDMFKDEEFNNVCEVALSKSRNPKTIKYASLLQHLHIAYRRGKDEVSEM